MTQLSEKHILLGVTGGIAAYKSVELASRLVKAGATVDVVFTDAAEKFVRALTFEAITHRNVYVGLWDEHIRQPEHIQLAERPNLVVVAPATANTLAKYVHGLADNLLSSTLLACKAPLLVAPAMNDNMWTHPATQNNMKVLKAWGVHTIGPEEGRLASGKIGAGRMSEPDDIMKAVLKLLS